MNKQKQKLRGAQTTLKKQIFKKWKKPHCQYCGNNNKKILQLHHIKAVSDGGNNDLKNIIFLCPNCHKMVHFGQISTEELINLKLHPKTFIEAEKLETKLEKLQQKATDLENTIKTKSKTVSKLNIHFWKILEDIDKHEIYLKEMSENINSNKTTFQLCRYIDRVEYKLNLLKEENKQILRDQRQLIQENEELKISLAKINKPTFKQKLISLCFD